MTDAKKLYKELKDRGLMFDVSGDFFNTFDKPTTFYIGTDSTGDSLHIGHLLAFTTAKLLQSYGHKPIILIGSFTAKVGDPSFRDTSRPMISDEQVAHNSKCIEKQVRHLLDFDTDAGNKAVLVDNDQWLGNMNLSTYMKDVTKLITVNSMLSRESVKKRLNREGDGMTLCEMLYQTFQGYDFLHLYREFGCRAECGGSDQWANCLVGQEFIRKTLGKTDTCVFTWPLVTRADGTKFGKSSQGTNVYLDAEKTSPFTMYQFWINQSDADAEKFIKMFTLIPLNDINEMIKQHHEAPEKRLLQKELAKYMVTMIHSEEEYNKAVQASEILYGKSTTEQLQTIDEKTLLAAMNGVPTAEVTVNGGIALSDIAIECKDLFTSKGDFRKLVKGGGVSVNKVKVNDPNLTITKDNLLNGKYLLMQKGKKYSLVIAKG